MLPAQKIGSSGVRPQPLGPAPSLLRHQRPDRPSTKSCVHGNSNVAEAELTACRGNNCCSWAACRSSLLLSFCPHLSTVQSTRCSTFVRLRVCSHGSPGAAGRLAADETNLRSRRKNRKACQFNGPPAISLGWPSRAELTWRRTRPSCRMCQSPQASCPTRLVQTDDLLSRATDRCAR